MPPRTNPKCTSNKDNPSTINPFGRGFVMAALNINSLLVHLDDLKFFVLDSKIDVLYWLSMKRRLKARSMIMKYTCQDLRLLGKTALLMAKVVVVFAYIYGITQITRSVTIYVMTNLNVLSSKLSDPTPDLLLSVRSINLQILPKISFGNLSL